MTPRKPVTDWATDWDHLDPRWREDPFPIWDELRRSCPIAHTERYQGAFGSTSDNQVEVNSGAISRSVSSAIGGFLTARADWPERGDSTEASWSSAMSRSEAS